MPVGVLDGLYTYRAVRLGDSADGTRDHKGGMMILYSRTLIVVASLFLLVGCPNTADSHKTVKRSGLRSTLFSIPEITTVANFTKTLNFTSQDEPINS